uniref:Oxidation resistance protein 1 n=1 Tax=Echinostoma caproni TaxID=27848 RepID=A0A183A1G9_9TREM
LLDLCTEQASMLSVRLLHFPNKHPSSDYLFCSYGQLLGANFPSHWIGCNLSLIYKTDQDGYSLNTLYRKSQHTQGGVLLVIRDTMGTVFGAILSEGIHCSKHFYGTGETCVFQWAPMFKVCANHHSLDRFRCPYRSSDILVWKG